MYTMIWVAEGADCLSSCVVICSYSTEEEAAEAHDVAALKCHGLKAKTNFHISRSVQTNHMLTKQRAYGIAETQCRGNPPSLMQCC